MPACPAISDASFLTSVLSYVDCQAQTIGEQGYQALATPGSAVGLVLGGALTIFIALIGYRLLLGEVPGLREAIIAAVKVGVVLMLATSWPAFRVLAYDVALKAPSELAGDLARSSGVASGNNLVSQLQMIDNEMIELIQLGTGQPPAVTEQPGGSDLDQVRGNTQVPLQRYQPRWDPARDATLLGTARTTFLSATIAAFAAARLIAGLLLALAPLFALFLLFDGTRSLFEGWLRALIATALGALVVTVLLGIETALVLPWLSSVLQLRYANIATPAVPVELLVLSLVFGLTLLAGLVGAARVGQAFRLVPIAERVRVQVERAGGGMLLERSRAPAEREPVPERSRALRIADAVTADQRRDLLDRQQITIRERADGSSTNAGPDMTSANTPLGQSFRRRTRGRVSAGARRRDATL